MIKVNKKQTGQVAIILILIIGIMLIFYAVALNIGKVAQLKTMTTIASNQAAALLASEMAGYAESYYQLIGGQKEAEDDLMICKVSSVGEILIGALIAVIVYVAMAALPGGMAFSWAMFTKTSFIVFAVTTAAAAGLASVALEPALNDRFNKLYEAVNLDTASQFLERGVLVGLQMAVSDDVQIFDDGVISGKQDMDSDGLTSDKVTRFGASYNHRIERLADPGAGEINIDPEIIRHFFEELSALLYRGTDNWGLWDPWSQSCGGGSPHACCNETNRPAECNCCCLPKQWCEYTPLCECGDNPDPMGPEWPEFNQPDYNGDCEPDVPNLRPTCCDHPDPELSCGTTTNCPDDPRVPSGSTYPYDPNDPEYPKARLWVFDPLLENRNNPFVSFREYLGRDDGSQNMKTNPPGNFNNPQILDTDPQFRQVDARGIFSTLWLLSYEYNRILLPCVYQPGGNPLCQGHTACQWCSDEYCGYGSGALDLNNNCMYKDWLHWYYYAYVTPGFPALNPYYCCATQDFIDPVSDIRNFLIESYQCSGAAGVNGIWKKGVDDFCSLAYPYNINCVNKHCSASCEDPCSGASGCAPTNECPNPSATSWPEDTFDTAKTTLDQFINFANVSLNQEERAVAKNFLTWYPEAEKWLGITASGIPNPNPPPPNVPLKDGELKRLTDTFIRWRNTFNVWLAGPYTGLIADEICPASGQCQDGMRCNEGEACLSTDCFPRNTGGHTVADIINCLSGKITEYRDRRDRINACLQACRNANPIPNANPNDPTCARCDNCVDNDCANYAYDCDPAPPSFLPPYDPTFFCTNTPTNPILQEIIQFNLDYWNNKLTEVTARRNYLNNIYSRVNGIVNNLNTAITKINAFLNDADVRKLAQEYYRMQAQPTIDLALKPYAIYAWKGQNGSWHIVRSEARIPTKCDFRCGRCTEWDPDICRDPICDYGGAGCYRFEPNLPNIKNVSLNFMNVSSCTFVTDSFDQVEECNEEEEYTEARKCFRGGTVKSRIIRYDQDRDIMLKFANNISLWKTSFYHPQKGPAPAGSVGDMVTACTPLGAADNGFFMLNDSEESPGCYAAVGELLRRGVMSETCAEYFFHQEEPYGFGVKFVKCRGAF